MPCLIFLCIWTRPCSHVIWNRAAKTISLRPLTPGLVTKWRKEEYILHPNDVPLKHNYVLDQSDMVCLVAELIWRTSPGRVICLPPLVSVTALLATTELEIKNAKASVEIYLSRADILLVPILTVGRWTLLVLESTCPSGERNGALQAPSDEALEPLEEGGAIGCGQCRYNSLEGCAACEKTKHTDQVRRR